jgi:Leucine-rich repeat (LRR) protein
MASSEVKVKADWHDQKLFEIVSISSSNLWDHTSTLTVLNLSQNFIDDIPEELFQIWNLQRLNLFNNKLKTIPDGISKLQKVYYIIFLF